MFFDSKACMHSLTQGEHRDSVSFTQVCKEPVVVKTTTKPVFRKLTLITIIYYVNEFCG